jgi:hypothetical protein
MVNQVIGKGVVKSVGGGEKVASKILEKDQPSKFNQVWVKIQDKQLIVDKLPAEVTEISPHHRRALESDLRRRIEQNQTATEIFKPDLKKARAGLEGLTRQVNAIPKNSAFDPIRERLQRIEAQFRESGKLIDGLGKLDNPRDLLRVQTRLYQVTQNIEIMAKVVEQVNTGIKSILQTQV